MRVLDLLVRFLDNVVGIFFRLNAFSFRLYELDFERADLFRVTFFESFDVSFELDDG